VAPDTTVRDAARTMLAHAVSRLVVVADGRIEGVVTRHAVLAALLRADRAVEAAVSGLLAERDEPDVAATVANGTVELSGQARRRSTAEVLPREISAIGGVVSVDTRLRWRDDDLVPGATQGSADRRPPPT
jgi:CBS domain-containing protein